MWTDCRTKLPDADIDVLLYVIDRWDGGHNQYVGKLVVKPGYITGRKHKVAHEERRYFIINTYGHIYNDEELEIERVLCWRTLPEGPIFS